MQFYLEKCLSGFPHCRSGSGEMIKASQIPMFARLAIRNTAAPQLRKILSKGNGCGVNMDNDAPDHQPVRIFMQKTKGLLNPRHHLENISANSDSFNVSISFHWKKSGIRDCYSCQQMSSARNEPAFDYRCVK